MDPQMAESFRRIPYGIYVLTAKQGTEPRATIVSWVSQVSYDPPLLMVALRHNRQAVSAIRQGGFFSLSLLKIGQKAVVTQLKNPASARAFLESPEATGKQNAPFLKEALVSWDCRLFSVVEAGDHILFIGQVQAVSASSSGAALTTGDYGKTYIGQS